LIDFGALQRQCRVCRADIICVPLVHLPSFSFALGSSVRDIYTHMGYALSHDGSIKDNIVVTASYISYQAHPAPAREPLAGELYGVRYELRRLSGCADDGHGCAGAAPSQGLTP
jgi:hypothetical protein